MAVSKKPRKKKAGNWADRLVNDKEAKIRRGEEIREQFNFIGRLKGLNQGSYTRNASTGLMDR